MSLDTAAPPTPVDPKVGGDAASTEMTPPTQASSHAKTASISSAAAPAVSAAAATSSPNTAAGNSSSNPALNVQQLTLRALVTSREAGIIIGKAGKNVADLREATGVRAGVSKVVPGVPDRVLTVSGTLEGIVKAYGSILRNLADNATVQGETEQAASGSNSVVRLLVANAIMGGIIGKAGANIQGMQQKYSSKIVTVKEMLPSSTERIVSVEGSLSAVEGTVGELARILSEQDPSRLQGNLLYQPGAHAANPIAAVGAPGPNVGPVAAGGGPAAFGGAQGTFGGQPFRAGNFGSGGPRRQQNGGQQRGFRGNGNDHSAPAHSSQAVPTPSNPELRTQNISIPADMVGCIIGRGGSKINEIRTSSGARISIAKTAHDETGERMFTITGPSTSLEKALFMLYSQLEAEKEKRIQNQQNAMGEGQ